MRKYNIPSDFVQTKSLQPIVYKQYDNGDKLVWEPYDDGEKVNLTNETVLAFFELEDGTVIEKTCEISNGNAVASLDNNVLSLGGKLKAEFTIYKDGKETTTRTIMINVEESINRNEAIKTIPQWDIVQQVLDFKPSLESLILETEIAVQYATESGEYAIAQGDYVESKKPIIDKFTGDQTNLQAQLDVLVVEGDSSPAAAQARVDGKGTTYATLKQRLDTKEAEFSSGLAEMSAEKASKTEVNSLATSKAEKAYVDTQISTLDTKINSQASGSPKGTYETLAALQTAFPTGNSNIYVVTADGKWYFWNGSAWTVGGVYQSTGLDTTTETKIKKSAEAISYNNYAWNGKPDTTDYYSFTLANGNVDTVNKEIRFTPTARLGQVVYTGIRNSGINLANQLYLRFAIKCASGVKNDIRVILGYNGTNIIAKTLPQVTSAYQYVTVIFDKNTYPLNVPNIKIADYDSSGFVELSVKDLMILDLTEQYGGGKEPTKEVMDSTINGLGVPYFEKFFNSGVVSKAKTAERATVADSLSTPLSISKPLYVSFQNDELRVISKYNGTKDILYVLGKKGVNNIFDFKEIKHIDNTTPNVSEDVNAGSVFSSFSSDNFGPHVIRATGGTGNGDQPASYHFTGGNHGYDNTGNISGNSPTGRTSSISLKVEGRKVTSYQGHANYIEIKWTNFIQGSNTKKVDGTGREILKETYTMIFDGLDWDVEYQSETLETIEYTTFYGLQFQTAMWNGGVLYHTSPNKVWNPNNGAASNSTNKSCNRITVRSLDLLHYVDIDLDTNFGIGNRELATVSTFGAFSTEYKKCYWNLIKDSTVPSGSILTFRGKYKFYSA
jgi:hypothetical protein